MWVPRNLKLVTVSICDEGLSGVLFVFPEGHNDAFMLLTFSDKMFAQSQRDSAAKPCLSSRPRPATVLSSYNGVFYWLLQLISDSKLSKMQQEDG